MNAESGLKLATLKVDGGMTSDHLLMQLIADMLNVLVMRPMAVETVSLGAAYAAGLTVGFWPDLDGLRRNWHRTAQWLPQRDPRHRTAEYANWQRAVELTFGWMRSKGRFGARTTAGCRVISALGGQSLTINGVGTRRSGIR